MTFPPLPYGEPVTLQRTEVTGRDGYGNDVYNDVSLTVPGCAIWPSGIGPGAAREGQIPDADLVVTGLAVLIPPGVVVKATDRMVVRGEVYEVEGEPGYWHSYLTGRDAGTQVSLRRVEG